MPDFFPEFEKLFLDIAIAAIVCAWLLALSFFKFRTKILMIGSILSYVISVVAIALFLDMLSERPDTRLDFFAYLHIEIWSFSVFFILYTITALAIITRRAYKENQSAR